MKYFSSHIFGNIILSLIFACIIIAIIYESIIYRERDFSGGSNNTVFILDVSSSMNVRDMGGEDRLNIGKKKILSIMQNNPGNAYALTIFAGESMRVLPLSRDVGLLATFLAGIDNNNIASQGTNIISALDDAIESFSKQQTGKIIIISDGHDEKIEIPPKLIEIIKSQQIQLQVMGVGTSQGGYIPTNNPLVPFKVYNGERVISRLNKNNLKLLAHSIGGIYSDISDVTTGTNTYLTNKYFDKREYVLIMISILWVMYMVHIYVILFYKKYETN